MQVKREVYRRKWWLFAETCPSLYSAIEGMDRVLVAARVSKMLIFSWASVNQVFSEMVVVIPRTSDCYLSIFQSSFHQAFAWHYCSTMRDAGIRYSPTDATETFPIPHLTNELQSIGERYARHRQEVMHSRKEGLTKIYNRFHSLADSRIGHCKLRRLHVANLMSPLPQPTAGKT